MTTNGDQRSMSCRWHPLVGGEVEYIFTAYMYRSSPCKPMWVVDGAAHRIEIDAASNNRVEAEGGGGGQWATPVGSEDLPLAPWYSLSWTCSSSGYSTKLCVQLSMHVVSMCQLFHSTRLLVLLFALALLRP